MSTADEVYRLALDLLDVDGVADVNLVADDCGVLTLVAVEFDDDACLIVGPEDEGGYTFTAYSGPDYDGQPLAERVCDTDGDTTLDSLADAIRRRAAFHT